MPIRMDLEASDLERLRGQIADIAKRAKDMQKPLRVRAEALRGVILESFTKSQSPTGETWKPLAASTVERRRKGSSKPLVDTGLLRGSITAEAGKTSIRFGVAGAAAKYGKAHQFGGGKVPRRAFLPLDKKGDADFSAGPAKKWQERTVARLRKWLLEGK